MWGVSVVRGWCERGACEEVLSSHKAPRQLCTYLLLVTKQRDSFSLPCSLWDGRTDIERRKKAEKKRTYISGNQSDRRTEGETIKRSWLLEYLQKD